LALSGAAPASLSAYAMEPSHDADPGEHRRAVMFCNQQQRLHRGLPLFGVVFRLGKFMIYGARRGASPTFPARQCDRIEKLLIP